MYWTGFQNGSSSWEATNAVGVCSLWSGNWFVSVYAILTLKPFAPSGIQTPGPWTWRPAFNTASIHVGFLIDKVAMGQVFLRVLRVSPVSVIPPLFHVHFHLRVILTGKRRFRNLRNLQTAIFFLKSGRILYNLKLQRVVCCCVLEHPAGKCSISL
jgi:hypothetical protein